MALETARQTLSQLGVEVESLFYEDLGLRPDEDTFKLILPIDKNGVVDEDVVKALGTFTVNSGKSVALRVVDIHNGCKVSSPIVPYGAELSLGEALVKLLENVKDQLDAFNGEIAGMELEYYPDDWNYDLRDRHGVIYA